MNIGENMASFRLALSRVILLKEIKKKKLKTLITTSCDFLKDCTFLQQFKKCKLLDKCIGNGGFQKTWNLKVKLD